jgi:hypothetical protein
MRTAFAQWRDWILGRRAAGNKILNVPLRAGRETFSHLFFAKTALN